MMIWFWQRFRRQYLFDLHLKTEYTGVPAGVTRLRSRDLLWVDSFGCSCSSLLRASLLIARSNALPDKFCSFASIKFLRFESGSDNFLNAFNDSGFATVCERRRGSSRIFWRISFFSSVDSLEDEGESFINGTSDLERIRDTSSSSLDGSWAFLMAFVFFSRNALKFGWAVLSK